MKSSTSWIHLRSTFLAVATAICTLAYAQPTVEEKALEERLRAAQADTGLSSTLLQRGQQVAGFCANCHGANGNSTHAETPNLAGQNAAYLLEQIRQFGVGQRRNEFMQGFIRAMSVDEKVGVAMYFAQQKAQPHTAGDAALLERGKAYYSRACAHCHSEQGRGSEKIARIASQQTSYTVLTLKRYRDGSAVRRDPLMADATRTMSDADIKAVAVYLASMP